MPGLEAVFDQTFDTLQRARNTFEPELTVREIGIVVRVSTGIAIVAGLPGVGFEELVAFPDGLFGIAFDLDADEIGVVLLGDHRGLTAGDPVMRTARVVDVPVGDGLLGRVVNALGEALDEHGLLGALRREPIERPAPGIMQRAPVNEPLQTGVKAIDALIPIGRGQRELILGDRQTARPPDRQTARPPDRQDRDRGRYHPQSGQPEHGLCLLCDRPAGLLGGAGAGHAGRARRHGL